MASRVEAAAAISLAVLSLALVAGSNSAARAQANPTVVIETNRGNITVELFQDKAPKSVENFLAYAKMGFYKGTIFHRVIKGFMIQGGGFAEDMKRKPTLPPIANEAGNGLKNKRGTLAMARTGEVNSATAQFFINTVDNGPLDHRGAAPAEFGYAVFGKVTAGMDVVEQIEGVPTGSKGSYNNVPLQPIIIKDVKIK